MGRMSSVADADRTYLSGVTFGAATLPTQIALGNGTVQNFDFNERLQMKSQDLKRGTEVLQKYEYGFGELNAQSQLKNNGKLESVVSYIGSQKQWTQKFSYDSVGRLKEARETRGDNEALSYKQVFEFDRFGNLFRKATSNPTTGQDTPIVFTPIEPGDIDPAKNRFTSASGTAYNDNGQVVTDGKFRNLGYGYDANGRTVRASEANRPDAVSVYDALGNRVAEKVNDVWQFVIYDAFGKLVAEYGGTVPQDEGGVKFHLQDWQGSVRAGVNSAGYVKSRTDHQAFGEDIASGIGLRTTAQGFGAPTSNRQGYGLTEKDSATGLNHTWFRKNENRAGRWTSPDPYNGSASVGNPQSWNRYSYVVSQPTNYVDPSGLQLRYIDVRQGLGCVFNPNDGRFHCTEYINRYWYDDGTGGADPGTPGGDPGLPGGSGGGGGGGAASSTAGLTPCVKNLLKKFFPNLDLNAIRVELGLPEWAPTKTTAGGTIGGITVGNTIHTSSSADFLSFLGATWEALEFLAHEITHSDQYRRLGTVGFVIGYTVEGRFQALIAPGSNAAGATYDANAFETRARNNASRIIRQLKREGATPCPVELDTIATVTVKG
ncbi:MAG: hypothetical protein IPN69_13610 [Acidobacteria bacterium]|nr:hypothetical protein [Acidobacteriota bacterium]